MSKKIFSISLLLLLSFSLFALDANALKDLAADQSSNVNSSTTLNISANTAMASGNYVVTAGDVYALNFLAGNSPVSYMISVDTSYKIRVANLAVLNVENISFLTLKRQVEEIVTKNYPMSGVQFTLVTPGSFNVVIKGEVASTKEVPAWALTRLSSVVNQYKNSYASIRNIKVTSKYGKTKTYDLFLADRLGDLSQDPFLRPGDVITLAPYNKQVTISGAVKRPGTYELINNEGLNDLINYYGGGLAPLADTHVLELSRIASSKFGEKFMLNQSDIDNNYELFCYDSVNVFSYDDLKPSFTVRGAIGDFNIEALEATNYVVPSNVLSFKFNNGETYENFARSHKYLFRSNADLEKAYVIRKEEVIPINLHDIIYEKATSTLRVEPNDALNIPAKQLLVSVIGAVKVPGRYPYMPGKNWNYYVTLAGGFIDEANSFDSVKITNMEGKKLSKDDEITPETTIEASRNGFVHFFNTYAPIITTSLTAVATTLGIISTIIAIQK